MINTKKQESTTGRKQAPFFMGVAMPDLDKNTQKEAIKEALQEWLDKQFAMLGRWTLGGIFSLALAALTYFWLTSNGWHK